MHSSDNRTYDDYAYSEDSYQKLLKKQKKFQTLKYGIRGEFWKMSHTIIKNHTFL